MTRQECIENHRKMWNWIADEMEKKECPVDKNDYFNFMGIPVLERPMCECYACEACKMDCDHCPFYWDNAKQCFHDDTDFDGFRVHLHRYQLFKSPVDMKFAVQFARKIADLPEREAEK